MSCAGYRPRPLKATALSRCAAECLRHLHPGRGATSDREESFTPPSCIGK